MCVLFLQWVVQLVEINWATDHGNAVGGDGDAVGLGTGEKALVDATDEARRLSGVGDGRVNAKGRQVWFVHVPNVEHAVQQRTRTAHKSHVPRRSQFEGRTGQLADLFFFHFHQRVFKHYFLLQLDGFLFASQDSPQKKITRKQIYKNNRTIQLPKWTSLNYFDWKKNKPLWAVAIANAVVRQWSLAAPAPAVPVLKSLSEVSKVTKLKHFFLFFLVGFKISWFVAFKSNGGKINEAENHHLFEAEDAVGAGRGRSTGRCWPTVDFWNAFRRTRFGFLSSKDRDHRLGCGQFSGRFPLQFPWSVEENMRY